MDRVRAVHPDFQYHLDLKDPALVTLYHNLRNYLLELFPESNELLYHTHALTTVFSISEKLSDAFCHIPIYTKHLNLGFNKGTLLQDPQKLLKGTGKLIRHIEVNGSEDYRNTDVKNLILEAIEFAIQDREQPTKSKGKIISKIKQP